MSRKRTNRHTTILKVASNKESSFHARSKEQIPVVLPFNYPPAFIELLMCWLTHATLFLFPNVLRRILDKMLLSILRNHMGIWSHHSSYPLHCKYLHKRTCVLQVVGNLNAFTNTPYMRLKNVPMPRAKGKRALYHPSLLNALLPNWFSLLLVRNFSRSDSVIWGAIQYRARLKGVCQVLWIWGEKIAFSCLQQARKRNFFTTYSQSLGSVL